MKLTSAFLFGSALIIFASCVKLGPANGSGPNGPGNTTDSVNIVTTIAGSVQGFENGSLLSAQFNTPYAIAFNTSGNIFIADELNNCIRKIDTSAQMVTTYAGTGIPGIIDTFALNAQFNYPVAMAFDKAGNLYVADQGNNAIREISTEGIVSTAAGTGAPGFVNGTAANAQFYLPQGIAIDNSGNIFVADQGNHSIRKIDVNGNCTTFAGSATHGYKDAADTLAQFNMPSGMAIDAAGNIYVADEGNNCIRKITASGVVTTLAGSTQFGFADGTGTAASFAGPSSVAADSLGNIYVADEYNNRIRKITPAGVVTTLAGTGVAGYADGNGSVAEFYYPVGITLDASGNIYVADANNHLIRKVVLH